MPAISVVMPAYNAAAYIGESIESILQQTHQAFEFLIVDDGSSDQTPEIIAAYAARDARVRLLQSQRVGAGAARNLAIAQARHDWIALMDADDIALPLRLETQVRHAMAQAQVVVWGAYLRRITADGLPMPEIKLGPSSLSDFYALDRSQELISIYGTVAFFRKDIFLQCHGFDPRIEVAEDSELWDRMAAFGPALVIPQVLQLYRQHAKSLSVTKLNTEHKWHSFIKARYAAQQQGESLAVEDYIQHYEQRPRGAKLGVALRGLSQTYGRNAQIALARKQVPSAFYYSLLAVSTHPLRFMQARH